MTFVDDIKMYARCKWFGQLSLSDYSGACFHHAVEIETTPGCYAIAYLKRFCDGAACKYFEQKKVWR